MLGNSKFGSRYLFSVDIEAIANYLPMCELCLNKARHNKHYNSKKQMWWLFTMAYAGGTQVGRVLPSKELSTRNDSIGW